MFSLPRDCQHKSSLFFFLVTSFMFMILHTRHDKAIYNPTRLRLKPHVYKLAKQIQMSFQFPKLLHPLAMAYDFAHPAVGNSVLSTSLLAQFSIIWW